jgi:SAM-dependent methyltransferase
MLGAEAVDHSIYDKRRYPIVEVAEGYSAWAPTYEATVPDEMDLRLLERLRTVDWTGAGPVLDLACGTGRIGVWLRARADAAIDGIDVTPAMLERAAVKGVYRRLHRGDIVATGLPAQAYGLCVLSLADEHLPDLGPLYREVGRLTRPGGPFVIVGYHPQFLMMGIPTHFERTPGHPVTIRSHVHLLSDHVKAAHAAGWVLLEMDEAIVDDGWLRRKPQWTAYRGMPVSFTMAWRRDARDPPPAEPSGAEGRHRVGHAGAAVSSIPTAERPDGASRPESA